MLTSNDRRLAEKLNWHWQLRMDSMQVTILRKANAENCGLVAKAKD